MGPIRNFYFEAQSAFWWKEFTMMPQCRYCLCRWACGKIRCLDATVNAFNLLYLCHALSVSQNEGWNPGDLGTKIISGSRKVPSMMGRLFAMDHTLKDVHLNWKGKYSSNLICNNNLWLLTTGYVLRRAAFKCLIKGPLLLIITIPSLLVPIFEICIRNRVGSDHFFRKLHSGLHYHKH